MSPRERLDALRRARPRSRLLRGSLAALASLVAYSWLSGDLDLRGLLTERRLANLERFLAEIVPFPLREGESGMGALGSWAGTLLVDRGAEAALVTAAISVLAIVLAGAFSWLMAPLAARSVANCEPFLGPATRCTPAAARAWALLRFLARALMVLLRAIPEYLLAFLLLAVLGPETAWPAVLALALHNSGILGRLGAETIENLDPEPLRSLRVIGAPRRAVLVAGVFPLALGRYLLYFFYRFETCVREATVLGMLGVVSLGYWIQDARAKQYYDEMLFLVLLGAGMVLAADLISFAARRALRGTV